MTADLKNSSTRSAGFIAAALRDAIARGRYLAGERIYQEEVAETFAVSRQPVRHAFQRLQAEGVLTEIRPGRLIVSKLNIDQIVENVSLRALLEPEAARLAALHSTPERIAELRRVNQLITDDPGSKADHNYEFHKIIADMAGSPLLSQFIDRLWFGMPISPMSWSLRQNTAENSAWHHSLMIDVIEKHDAAAAESLMREHIGATRDFLLRRQEKEADAARLTDAGGVAPPVSHYRHA